MRIQLRKLQHLIVVLMVSSTLVLGILFSVAAYQLNYVKAEKESRELLTSLIGAVDETIAAALFAKNKTVIGSVISDVVGNSYVHSVAVVGVEDFFLAQEREGASPPLFVQDVELNSPFDETDLLGHIKVSADAGWVRDRAIDASIPIISWLLIVMFSSSLVAAQLFKRWISAPLTRLSRQLRDIEPDGERRLEMPRSLAGNEIGSLVMGFNNLLEETNMAFKTERKLREEMVEFQSALKEAKLIAESATNAKSNFLATMSHEIRTPLTGVLGMLKFVLDDQKLAPKSREKVNIALNNAESLMIIINDILDLSKIEAGKLRLDVVSFNARNLIKNSLLVFDDMASNKGISLVLKIEDDVPEFIVADPARIRQILVNIVGNAIKFTSEGCVNVRVSAVGQTSERLELAFEVADTGIGIAEDVVPRLFDKFEQGDATTTRRFAGTGLGLSICRELIDMMNGRVNVHSVLGKGTTFEIQIPVEIGAYVEEAEQKKLFKHSHKLSVLCAEDFPTNQIIIRTLLENMGHDATVVENGKQALQALAKNTYDLVLLDGRMPEMDGDETVQWIRKGGYQDLRFNEPDMRVVALTANVTENDRRRYLQAGMDDFLSKPIDEYQLHRVLTETINELLQKGRELYPLITVSDEELDRLFGVDPSDHLMNLPSKLDSECCEPEPYTSGVKEGLQEKLRQAFIESLPQRLIEIDSALDRKDFEELGRLFHGIKGSAGYLPDMLIVSTARSLEFFADSGADKPIGPAYSLLKDFLKPYLEGSNTQETGNACLGDR